MIKPTLKNIKGIFKDVIQDKIARLDQKKLYLWQVRLVLGKLR